MPLGQVGTRKTTVAGSMSGIEARRRFWGKASVWLLLGAILAVVLVACGRDISTGQVADFPITVYTGADAVGGEEIVFSDLRGRPVVLNFWAGLCPPCRAEMPDLQNFYDEYQDRIEMLGVDVGQFTHLGNQKDARALLDALGITYPTGFTNEGSVIQEYGVLTMPTTVFITPEGQVFRKWTGSLDRDQLAEITNEMLSQSPRWE